MKTDFSMDLYITNIAEFPQFFLNDKVQFFKNNYFRNIADLPQFITINTNK